MLSLCTTEIAFSLVRVETRSHNPSTWEEENTAPNPSLDLLRQLTFVQQEVQELRGKLEEQAYQLQQLQEQQKKRYLDLERRLEACSTLSNATINLDDHSLSSSTMQIKPSGVTSQNQPFIGEEKAYQRAYHFIQTKDYENALLAFKNFLVEFPQGKYFPNAQYWLGEIYFTKGELDLAAQAFEMVYQHYPQHPKAADSLLKLGYVEYNKGQWKRSQQLLKQVTTQFPGSTSAQLAQARLEKMHYEGH